MLVHRQDAIRLQVAEIFEISLHGLQIHRLQRSIALGNAGTAVIAEHLDNVVLFGCCPQKGARLAGSVMYLGMVKQVAGKGCIASYGFAYYPDDIKAIYIKEAVQNLEHNAAIILMSHLGRPKGDGPEPELSLSIR